ncbi:hypothetical protein [Pseudonocardia charpentierae]|uniref:Uncharacterized protein n=1 Tax=Pseudonocardia charpentierae TaxID=3075545 RepID=A0ABU2NHE4_9PSEU|nr:hypothetical protein [Pseudonocardia sp. DSM 45834]MDT0353372.1 hypothetical protein [Pseudonocardia sp. DSM 45834]
MHHGRVEPDAACFTQVLATLSCETMLANADSDIGPRITTRNVAGRRPEPRASAHQRDDIAPALPRYAELVGLDPAPRELRHAVAQLVRAETEKRRP